MAVESLSWSETWPAFGLDGIATEYDFSSNGTTSITYRHESVSKRDVSGGI